MSKSVLIHRTSLGKFIIKLGMAIVILLIPVSSYSLPYQSPKTQNVEQTNVPDYISQAKVAVKKYYLQYEEYFKPIFNKIDKIDKSLIEIINKYLDNAIKKSKDKLKTEKHIYTMVLMTIEKLDGKNTLYSDTNIVENKEEREDIEYRATIISNYITKSFNEKKIENENKIEKQKKITEKIINLSKIDELTREDTEELLDVIEELYNEIENTEYLNDKRMKFIFNEYYTRSRDIGRQPNETGKKIIKWLKDHQE